jgi:hypothetical protein
MGEWANGRERLDGTHVTNETTRIGPNPYQKSGRPIESTREAIVHHSRTPLTRNMVELPRAFWAGITFFHAAMGAS